MIAAVEASSSASKSSGRAARAGDLVVLGPALDPRVRVVLEVVPSRALETDVRVVEGARLEIEARQPH